MSDSLEGFQIINRHLDHGDYWPNGLPTDEQRPERLVVHAMANQLDYNGERLYAASFLDKIELSAHILLPPYEPVVIRCREDIEIAWHALGFNINSIGLEFLVPDVYDYSSFLQRIREPWIRPSSSQYQLGVGVAARICNFWSIPIKEGYFDQHSDIDPSRKYDPGSGFPWNRFIKDVRDETEFLRS